MRVDVDPEVFDAASRVFGRDMADGVHAAWSTLTASLSTTGAMAGTDHAGTTWSAAYDPAAQDTAAVIGDLANACTQIAALLQQTGFNHGMAEAHSDPTRTVPTPADTTNYAAAPAAGGVCIPGHDVPYANGGSGSPPSGWGMVEHLVGYLWPNGDPGRLRHAAAAWSTAAGSLEDVSFYLPEATEAIATQSSPEVEDALTVCRSMGTHLTSTAASCRSLSRSCAQLAGYIDTAHHSIENELTSLVEWTAGIEAVGGLVSVFTAGIAEAPTQAVEATRIAATAARIGKIIETLIDAARTVVSTVGTVVDRIAEVAGKLKIILGARLSEAATIIAARLPELGDDTGAISFGRLSEEEQILRAERLAANVKTGKDGEALVPGVKNTTHINLPRWGRLKFRIPDRLNEDDLTLGEIKNVSYQYYSRQLRDYVEWAQEHVPPYRVQLFVRAGDGTRLSARLQQVIDDGTIELVKMLPK